MKPKKISVIVFGPPSGGKDTQAKMLERMGFLHINCGELLKKRLSGAELDSMHSGNLAQDAIAIITVEEVILAEEKFPRLIVFNGFPRSEDQARWLTNMLSLRGAKVVFIYLSGLTREILNERRIQRLAKENRPDDCEEVFNRRMDLYEQYEREVIKYMDYHHSVQYKEINANQEVEAVARAVRGAVSEVTIKTDEEFSIIATRRISATSV